MLEIKSICFKQIVLKITKRKAVCRKYSFSSANYGSLIDLKAFVYILFLYPY